MSSYGRKHLKHKIDKMRPKKPLYKKLWFWVIVLSFSIASVIIYFSLFFSGIQINSISILGNQKVSTDELEIFANTLVEKNLITFGDWKLKSRSFLLVNKKNIVYKILDSFPVIENVTVKKVFPNYLEIIIKDKKPLGVYCGDAKCYYIDQNGIIFEELTVVPSGSFIVRQTDVGNYALTGEIAVEENRINSIAKIQDNLLLNFEIKLVGAVINNSSRLNIETEEGWKIYFDLSLGADINAQIEKLNSLLSVGLSDGAGESSRHSLKYIDLRPNDRAIVCDNDICGN